MGEVLTGSHGGGKAKLPEIKTQTVECGSVGYTRILQTDPNKTYLVIASCNMSKFCTAIIARVEKGVLSIVGVISTGDWLRLEMRADGLYMNQIHSSSSVSHVIRWIEV